MLFKLKNSFYQVTSKYHRHREVQFFETDRQVATVVMEIAQVMPYQPRATGCLLSKLHDDSCHGFPIFP